MCLHHPLQVKNTLMQTHTLPLQLKSRTSHTSSFLALKSRTLFGLSERRKRRAIIYLFIRETESLWQPRKVSSLTLTANVM